MTTDSGISLRAPAAVRIFIGVLALGTLGFVVVLMIADRAPAASASVFGDVAQRLSDRLDASGRLPADRRPGNDAIVHIGVWAAATTLVLLAVWRWWTLLPLAVGVFAASVIVELAQGRYSTSRAVERSDIAANAVGVACGTIGAVAIMTVWATFAAARGAVRRSAR